MGTRYCLQSLGRTSVIIGSVHLLNLPYIQIQDSVTPISAVFNGILF